MSTGRSGSDSSDSAPRRLGRLDALLDFANGREILVQLRAIARTERPLETSRFLRDGIENRARLARLREALRRAAAIAEQPLEDDARMRLHRERRRGRLPRNRVREEAVLAVAANLGRILKSELERRETRVFAEVRGGDLIDGRRQRDRCGPAPIAIVGVHAGQPHRGAAGVIAVAVAA